MFQKEIKKLRSMFQENRYPKSYFDKIFKRFLTEQNARKDHPGHLRKRKLLHYNTYLESESRRFINNLAKITKTKIDVNIVAVYKSFRIGRYL